MMLYKTNKTLLRIIVIALVSAFSLSGVSFAITDGSDFALAPPLATKPPCQIVNGLRQDFTIDLKAQLHSLKIHFYNAVHEDKLYKLLSLPEIGNIQTEHDAIMLVTYIELLRNAYDSIIDRFNQDGHKYFDAKITVELYVEGDDVILNVIDNGKTVDIDANGMPVRRKRDFDTQFGGVGSGEGQGSSLARKEVERRGGTIKWLPLKDGTKVEIRIPKRNLCWVDFIDKNKCIVITNTDVIESWNKETVRSVRDGETLGKSFRNRWAFVDVSYLIGQMLLFSKEHKLQNPKNILIPLIKQHIKNRNGEAEMLLEGYDIDGIEEVWKKDEMRGFSLPVKRNGVLAYNLIYNLQDGETNIAMRDGTKVYVKAARAIALSSEGIQIVLHEIRGLANWLNGAIQFLQKAGAKKESFDEFEKAINRLRSDDASADIMDILEEYYHTFSDANIERLKSILRNELSEKLNIFGEDYDREQMLRRISVAARVIRLYSGYYLKTETIKKSYVKLSDILTSYPAAKQRLIETVVNDFRAGDIDIYTDEVALFQVIRNLLRNAVEATADDRENRITIRTYLSEDKKSVFIQVEDQGIGISSKNLPKIFETGFTTKDDDKGLGLAIVKDLVENRCCGTISVQSEPGKGTTFTIRLPVAKYVEPSEKAVRIDDDSVLKERAEIALRSIYGHTLLEPIPEIMLTNIDTFIDTLEEHILKQKIPETIALYDYIKEARLNLKTLRSDVKSYTASGAHIAEQLSQIKDKLMIMQKNLKDKLEGSYSTNEYYIEIMNELSKIIDILKTQADFIMSNNIKDEVDINTLITESIPLIVEKLKTVNWFIGYKKGVGTKLEGGLPNIKLNSRLLRRILGNIISNAAKAVSGKAVEGQIDVTTKFNRIGNEILITISDNGTGVAPEMLESGKIPGRPRMFDLNASTRETGGGLGLAEAWYVVKDMGGTISVESEPGKGTTFTIRLPVREEQAVAPTPVVLSPESERIHATNFQDNINYIQAKEDERAKQAAVLSPQSEKVTQAFNQFKDACQAELQKARECSKEGNMSGVDQSMDKIYKLRNAMGNDADLNLISESVGDSLMSSVQSVRIGIVPKEYAGIKTVISQELDKINNNLNELAKLNDAGRLSEWTSAKIDGVSGALDVSRVLDSKPLIVALGTSWIKGYEKDQFLQYDALNSLISDMRNHTQFVVADDKDLAGAIKKKMGEKGFANARIIALAGEETITKDLAGFYNGKNVLMGIDNKYLTKDSYMRVMEMLEIASRLALDPGTPPNSPNIPIEKRGNFWVFIPKEEPMDYEQLHRIYEVQRFA